MNLKRVDEIHKINYLSSKMDTLYHQASLKLGITDSVSIILYSIYDAGGHCLLSDIYKKSIISKQTVNSAIRGLEADDILYLEQHTGRSKKIILTEKGKKYVDKTVVKLYKAEVQAFESWATEEINTYITLMEKYTDCFQKQIENL
ncbi:MAG: MarR family winged helix-turn-helix transcriptional regulator [Brevinema sp.]